MILKLKSFIQIGTFIFHKKFLATHVAVTSLMKQDILLRYITYVPHFGGTILENTLRGYRFY